MSRLRRTASAGRSTLHYPLVTSARTLRVIITADDFGLAAPVNAAVAQAHRNGVLTSASLMVAEAGAAEAIAFARRTPSLRVGLHLTVVDGRTVLPGVQLSAIVDASGRLSGRLVRAGFVYFFRPKARRELRAEVRAQLEAFGASGLELDHVDTHRHLVLHPTVLGLIIDLAREFKIRSVRLPLEPWRATRGRPARRRMVAAVRVACLAPWIALARYRLRRAGIRCNAEVRGLADTGQMDESTVLRLIGTLDRDITEIFFHPATAEPSTVPLPQPVSRHVAELDALCSPRVRSALERAGVKPIGYRDLEALGVDS
jgi:chitin disaccharide deacetylase